MLKKTLRLIVIFVTLFSFNLNIVFAYDFANSDNEPLVNGMINEIYDSYQQYIDLAGNKEKVEETVNVTSDSYWWPVGSIETTEKNGKLFATGNPSTVIITSSFFKSEIPILFKMSVYALSLKH